jgi:hypothetical protein
MNTPLEYETDSLPVWFDHFPEPHTIPSGWDLSDLLTQPKTLDEHTDISTLTLSPTLTPTPHS